MWWCVTIFADRLLLAKACFAEPTRLETSAAEDIARPLEILATRGEFAFRERHSRQCAPRPGSTEHEAAAFGHGHCTLRRAPRLDDIAEPQPGIPGQNCWPVSRMR
jgi:hypothetical protein